MGLGFRVWGSGFGVGEREAVMVNPKLFFEPTYQNPKLNPMPIIISQYFLNESQTYIFNLLFPFTHPFSSVCKFVYFSLQFICIFVMVFICNYVVI